MSFWEEIKEEWRKPFKGTKKDKEELLQNTFSGIVTLAAWQLIFAELETTWWVKFLGAIVVMLVINICLGILYYLIRKKIK